MAAIPASSPGTASVEKTPSTRAPRVEIVAITGDDVLLEQFGQLLDGEATIRQADNPAEARRLGRPSQPSVLLLDTRGLDDLATVVQDLQSPDGTNIVVLFAPADASSDIARAVRGSAAFAVLPIPVEPAQATAILDGAREECLARHALVGAPPPAPVPVQPAREMAIAAPSRNVASDKPAADMELELTEAPSGGRNAGHRSKLIVAAGSLALLSAVVVGFLLHEPATVPNVAPLPQSASPRPATGNVANPAPQEALQAGSVEELLEAARAAMRERRYTDPDGNNALNYFRSVLAQDARNGEAREGLERVGAVLHERVQAAIDAHRIDEASRTLAQLRSISPGGAGLASFDAAIADARIRKAVDDADAPRARELLEQAAATRALAPDAIARWRSELDRQQSSARAEQLAQLVSLRIRQGQLLEPADDSAKHYVAQLRRFPTDPRGLAADATNQLKQACLDKLRDAIARSQRTDIERWKAEARALGASAAELAAVQRDASARVAATAARQEVARVAALVQDRIADGRLLEPAGDSALFHLTALRGLDPSGTTVAANERALSEKLVEQGRAALADRRLDVARNDAAAARGLGLNLESVAALERDIAAATPAGAAGASHQAPTLTRTRYVAPVYPASALAQNVAGTVRLRLTVDAEGKVSDAVVERSDPPKVFDEAATTAARRWRFKPIGKKYSGVEATAAVDIVFKPEDAKK